MPRACVAPLGVGPAPLPRWPPLCKTGAFSLPQGALLLETAGHHFLSRQGRGEGLLATLDVLMVTCGTWNLHMVLFLSQAVHS